MNSKQTWDKLLNLKNASWNEGYTCHKLSFSSMRNSNQPAWPLAPCMASNSLNRFPAWPDWSPKMPFCTCSFTNMMASLKLSQESTDMKKCTLKSCHILEDEHDTWWQKGTGNHRGTVVDKTCCIPKRNKKGNVGNVFCKGWGAYVQLHYYLSLSIALSRVQLSYRRDRE